MSKPHHHYHWHFRHPGRATVEPPRIVAMALADELCAAVAAGPRQRQELVDTALCVGQWLADQGIPGRWDRVRPAEVLRGLDFLSSGEREDFLFSLVGLLGHAGLREHIPPEAAKRAVEEAARLTQVDSVRAFAQVTAAHLAGAPPPAPLLS